jgi:pilus assembly protein Flp/PilA
MSSLIAAIRQLRDDRRGVTALEYGFIASVLFGTVLVGFGALANTLSNTFTRIGSGL